MVANITAILVVMEQSEKLDTVGVICGVKPLTCRISNASELLSERVIKLAPSGSKVKLQRCREDKLSGGPTLPIQDMRVVFACRVKASKPRPYHGREYHATGGCWIYSCR